MPNWCARANAIDHGGGARAVRITVDEQHVCVEVDGYAAGALPTLGRCIALMNALAV
jgi:hypothetical protein